MTPDDLRDAVATHIHSAVPDVRWLALFGSVASGTATSDSDVDLAILASSEIEPEKLRRLCADLEHVIGRDVHLVDLRTASTVFRSQIVANAEVLYASGDVETEEFLDFVFSDYARLNEERALILRDIRERGRVHGR